MAAPRRTAIARQLRASPTAQERRRRELEASLDAPVETLNARLRGTFARVLPDWRDGKVRFRWINGDESGTSLVFA
jgi:hypothetical protein